MTAETIIRTYDDFVEAMLVDNWHFLENKSPYVLTEKNIKIISVYPIRAGGFGKFLEIKPPAKPLTSIAINGMNQRPYLHHRISLRCRETRVLNFLDALRSVS